MKNEITREQGIAVFVALVALGAMLAFGGAFFDLAAERNVSTVSETLESDEVTANASAAEGAGVVTEEIVEGAGDEAVDGRLVTVHYTGRLANGLAFDSSLDRGVPFQFQLGDPDMIPGWNAGIRGMKVGGERLVIIPPHLAYGEHSVGRIPPNSTLVFEVELLGVAR